jgi:hypothetical protein
MRPLRTALLLGLVCALLLALWLVLHRENWNERTLLLMLIWFAGGFFASLGSSLVLAVLARLGWLFLARIFRAVAFLPAFLVAGSLAFLIQSRFQDGAYVLNPERPFLSMMFSMAQVVAIFVYTVPLYLLPWMGPAMVLAGFALLPRPRGGSGG